MRIYEIDDIDKTFASSSGTRLDIDLHRKEVLDFLKVLLMSNSSSRNKRFENYFLEYENNLISILQSNFANDQSTTELKVKANQYLAEIQKLKGQL